MNEKKAKMLRRAIKGEGIHPRETGYNQELPYMSSPVIWNEALKVFVKGRSPGPLRLLPECGRFKYKLVKAAYNLEFK